MPRLDTGGLHCLGIRQASQMVEEIWRLFIGRSVLLAGADQVAGRTSGAGIVETPCAKAAFSWDSIARRKPFRKRSRSQ
jgi:hypothetical protein